MIVGAPQSRQIGEGRRPQSMSDHTTILRYPDMPPHYKADNVPFKGSLRPPPTCDTNKSTLAHKDPPFLNPPPHTSTAGTHLQPFTAPWLTEVARMTPLRPPERLSFIPTVGDYYQPPPSFQNIHLRTQYHPPQIINPPHYFLDFPPPTRPTFSRFPNLVDSRPSDLSLRSVSSTSSVRPLGPPPPPLPPLQPPPQPHPQPHPLELKEKQPLDLRDQKERSQSVMKESCLSSSKLSSTESSWEPLPKKRPHHYHYQHSFRAIPSSASTSDSIIHSSFPPPYTRETPETSYPKASSSSVNSKTPSGYLPSPQNSKQIHPTPFHAHFRKGSLVIVVENLRRIEDLKTSDFIEAANAADDLSLDPSTVSAISSNEDKQTSTITFVFPSTKQQIPVQVADDHPFFVFHKGWSSCSPQSTLLKYELEVHKLMVGDVCVSIRKNSVAERTQQSRSFTSMPPPKAPFKSTQSTFCCTASSTSAISGPSSFQVPLERENSPSKNLPVHSLPSSIEPFSSKENSDTSVDANKTSLRQMSNPSMRYLQRSIDDSQKEAQITSSKRKRRWSDPGQK